MVRKNVFVMGLFMVSLVTGVEAVPGKQQKLFQCRGWNRNVQARLARKTTLDTGVEAVPGKQQKLFQCRGWDRDVQARLARQAALDGENRFEKRMGRNEKRAWHKTKADAWRQYLRKKDLYIPQENQ